jgi:dipeptidyl aminopeptidase/acylaminoacyl peptidase
MRRAVLALLLLGSFSVPVLMAPVHAAPGEAIAAASVPERAFGGGDLFRLEGATDPQVSPDGTRIAYVRLANDVMSDSAVPAIWLVDIASGRQRPLVTGAGAQFSPRWSPDGRRLAYVAAGDGGAALHVLWLDGNADARITNLPDGPGAITWSPDGRSIAFTMRVPGEPPKLGEAPQKPEGAKWADDLEVIDKVTYRADDEGYRKPGYTHLFVISAEGGAARQLTFGDFDDDGPLSWTPDGRSILFSANRSKDWEREPLNSEVMVLDISSGALAPLTKRYGPDQAPQVSPDGRMIAYLGFDDVHRSYEVSQLYVMNRDGSGAHSLTAKLDRSIENAVWQGGSLIVSYDDHGARKIARVGLDGSVRELASGLSGGGELDRPYTAGSFAVSPGGVIAYTANGADRPADLWVAGKGAPRRLTDLNATWLAHKALASVTPLAVTAPDGKPIDAWLATPPGRHNGERVPLVLEIHGGPNSAYGPTFSTDVQLYAAHGYAVLTVNPRGSTSYGSAFANLIDRAYPGQDYDDLMAAVDAAIGAGIADPANLFVTGGSGGGALTAWIVGKTHRFRAAATQKPVINWVSEALTMDATPFTSRYWFDKRPWEDPMSYWNRSPLSLVGNVTTPTLVVVGSQDYRTPVSEAEQYYAALQIRGVPTMLVKVPGASHHGLAGRPSQSAAKAAAILAWFDKYRAVTVPTP